MLSLKQLFDRPLSARFRETEQQRLAREARLREWWIERVLEDRAETAEPPLELLEPAGHG